MGGRTNIWTGIPFCIDVIDGCQMMIFEKILKFLQKRYRPRDRQTDGPTDQRTDITSYSDALAASKNALTKVETFVIRFQIQYTVLFYS